MDSATKKQIDIFDERGRLAKMLVLLRELNYKTQTKVGNVISVTFQQTQKYENGINGISSEKLFMLCRAMGYDFDLVCNGNPYQEINKISNPALMQKLLIKFQSIDAVMAKHRKLNEQYQKVLPKIELEMNYQKTFLTENEVQQLRQAEHIHSDLKNDEAQKFHVNSLASM